MSGIVENALAAEPERLLEDWGDIVDPREPFNDSPEFGIGPNVTYYSQLRDRADGRFLPVYDHEMDLRHIRAMAWLLSERVPMAQAWVNRLLDYTIGTGFDWTIMHDNPQLQKECNRAIVDATDNSRWTSDLERESYTREIVDGEWLSELEVAAGQIRIVTREADELTEPANKPAVTRWIADDESDFEKKSWTFGVLTNSKSTEIPIGYHFVRTVDGTDWDYCDASTVIHWKRNVRAKAKRGVSDFYKPHMYLMRADRVLTNTADGAATAAAIAYIVEHPAAATQANVQAIAARYAPQTGRVDQRTGEVQRKRRMAPNTRIDVPNGAKYHAGLMGSNSSKIYIEVMESALRLAGTVHAFPEGMLTGSYQNANYASSLTAESPFVQGRVAEQMHRAARVKEMFLKILKLACERGRFRHCGIEAWKDMAPGLNVEIQPAKVFPKNIKETTDALVIQKAQGWVDDKSAMTELGRDYDAVRLQQTLEKGQTPQQPGEVDPNAPQQPETTPDQPSGIYSQISRQQWIRNGKAIQDVVGNLVNGTTTPVLASVMLSTLGLDKETAQAIVDDVQSRGQESFQECEKIRRSNLLDSREQRKQRKLVEGGKGSGITGHKTFRNKAAEKGRKTQAPAGKETTRLSYEQIMASKTPQQRAIFEKAKKEGVIIPPAWTEVVYHGKDENIKAEGRDLAGRKQRVEDKAFRQNLSNANNERIAKTLIPKMQTIRKKLKTKAASGDEESKVLYLITQSGFRIGGKGDGKSKLEAFGATTLQGQHVKVQGDTVHFNFPGKKGVQQVHSIKDPVIAKMIGTPKIGERVFKTTDAKVREKWQSEFGGEKVHDIRHAVATEVAQRHLFKMIPPPPKSQAERNAIIKASSIESARVLGNNPSQALSTYINPGLWTSIKVQE